MMDFIIRTVIVQPVGLTAIATFLHPGPMTGKVNTLETQVYGEVSTVMCLSWPLVI